MAAADSFSVLPVAAAAGSPVFDASVLSDMFGDDGAVIDAVLNTFQASMQDSIVEMQALVGSGSLLALAALAHRIKGAARMSGAIALAQAAMDLERHAKAGELQLALTGATALDGQWRRLSDYFAAAAAAPPARGR